MLNQIALIAILIVTMSSTPALADDPTPAEPKQADATAWILPPLTREERFEKINEFIKPHAFEVVRAEGATTTKECAEAATSLKTMEATQVLEATHIAQASGAPWIAGLLSRCAPELQPDKDFHPSLRDWQDITSPNHKHSYYFQAAANMEFFDLSPFLEDGLWGYFAEGGTPVCRERTYDVCADMVGFNTTGKVFNVNTCQTILSRPVLGGRLRAIAHEGTVRYIEQGAFFAFVLLNDSIYRLDYRTDQLPSSVCPSDRTACPMTSDGSDLFLLKLAPSNSDAGLCVLKPEIDSP